MRRPLRITASAVALLLSLGFAACSRDGTSTSTAPSTTTAGTAGTSPATSGTGQGTTPSTRPSGRLRVEVLERLPHDPGAFTQGLVLTPDGRLVESTGMYGESDIREVDLGTGEVRQRVPVEDEVFAEGLAQRPDGSFVQLSWKEGVAIVRDATTLEERSRFRYDGEGWGLCADGTRLVMSDGSATLTFRDPATFEPTGSVAVTRDGRPVVRLNELECADGLVYANVWQTDEIVVIDPADGRVVASIDAAGLLTPEEEATADVLNGIAAMGDGTFLVTGKDWPWLFRVRFVPN